MSRQAKRKIEWGWGNEANDYFIEPMGDSPGSETANHQEPGLSPKRLSGEGAAVAKRWRIDLVLFVNGIPVVTMELKSEFKQAVENAIRQYQKTRLPKDPETNKPEPLLTFKRVVLVHFAVSQYEAYMTTRLAGAETRFLPFHKGTKDGGAGNDAPQDEGIHDYATDYLWNEVLTPANLLQIIGRFIHLEIKTEEDWDGRKSKTESLIFPRYHQLSSLCYDNNHSEAGDKVFHSVIVVTDRTVLDDQLQDTIYQFEHADGVVGRINRDEGQGSKSQYLNSPELQTKFQRVIFDMLLAKGA